MLALTREFIRNQVADSAVIYRRGVQIYEHGSFVLKEAIPEKGWFTYDVDGNYGDYITKIQFSDGNLITACDCPYPGQGCKHTVAVLFDARDVIQRWQQVSEGGTKPQTEDKLLTPEEIRQQALDDRRQRARQQDFTVTLGDMYKGEHLVETPHGRLYTVTLHDPENGQGHCTCPDYLSNRLGTCKHILFLTNLLKKKRGFKKRLSRERFPFVDIYWDSIHDQPRLFSEQPKSQIKKLNGVLSGCFRPDGTFIGPELSDLMPLLAGLNGDKRVRVQESVLSRLDDFLQNMQMAELARTVTPPAINLSTQLYPYQEDGVHFGLFKKAALIGDEMGLGKTLQAIALAIQKKKIFDFRNVLVITMASLKEQWKREIERFSNEKATVVAGPAWQRQAIYSNDESYFKVTNYEAVLRDVTVISRLKPDLVILDEAQRIKNFSTKTADAVKRLPRKHALVLTGTPLENKLEDVYSIIQFLDPLCYRLCGSLPPTISCSAAIKKAKSSVTTIWSSSMNGSRRL
jgi:hypothetical protein